MKFDLTKKTERNKISLIEHRQRHVQLHRSLDELIADFIEQTYKLPSETTLMELMAWSHEQTLNPKQEK